MNKALSIGWVSLLIGGWLAGCSHDNHDTGHRAAAAETKTVKHPTASKQKTKKENQSALEKLTGDYRRIAIIARDYQLPKEGRISKKERPDLYKYEPDGVIIYDNLYVFQNDGRLDSRIATKDHSAIQPPTKGQYLGVIMAMVDDIVDELDFKGLLLNPGILSQEEKREQYFKDWNTQIDGKPADLAHKYKRLNELIRYAQGYPIILTKLKDIQATFEQAEQYGKSKDTIEKALELYHQGCEKAKKLSEAFAIGRELKKQNGSL